MLLNEMTPLDHGVALSETKSTPLNMGAMLLFAVKPDGRKEFGNRMREYMEQALLTSPITQRLVQSPDGYSADAWFRMSAEAVLAQISRPQFDAPMNEAALRDYITARGMEMLTTSTAPFEIDIIDEVDGPNCAVYVKLFHGIMDGVGFQTLLESLSDQGDPALRLPPAGEDESIPSETAWRQWAKERFEREAPQRAAQDAHKAKSLQKLMALESVRPALAPMSFGTDVSTERAYITFSIKLAAYSPSAGVA
jgi:hypothetical protein